jgi:hypothetical protein
MSHMHQEVLRVVIDGTGLVQGCELAQLVALGRRGEALVDIAGEVRLVHRRLVLR